MDNYKVHTILFDISKNTLEEVLDFLINHKFKLKKIDVMENGNYYRARQLSPEYLKRIGYDDFRTITLDKNKNIKMVIGYNRNKDLTPKIIEGGLLLRKSKYL